jgi:transcription elongation factor GreA
LRVESPIWISSTFNWDQWRNKLMVDVIYLTKEGFEKKKRELDYLLKVRRPQVLERIRQCQDRGDREEEGGDTEFQEAKREQSWVESRIEELRKVLAVSEILETNQISLERVGFGSIVHLRDLDTRQKRICQIVSALEADPATNRISAESPVGTALLDKVPGDVVEVKTPAGTRRYKVLKLTDEFPPSSSRLPSAPSVPKSKPILATPTAKPKSKPTPTAKPKSKPTLTTKPKSKPTLASKPKTKPTLAKSKRKG